jgi:dTDP-4-amino-4,6-dideoxygalactose transaminase
MGDEEVAAAEKVLRSNRINYWTGTECKEFEREYADFVGRRHAISVANGTLALELALRAFEVGPGDEVVVPARTFFATAAAVVAVGATPVVADIDPVSGNMTAETLEAVLGPSTRAVIPVHVGGWPVDMGPLVFSARRHGVLVIEDCAQAHGAAIDGVPVGNLGSDAAAFSFCQDKIVPLGEGGMLLLDDEEAYRRAWAYKDHGKSLEKVQEAAPDTSSQSFRWLIDSFGSNWRMLELTGALGRVGLRKLPDWHKKRTRNALLLAEGLAETPGLRIPLPPSGVEHAFYRLHGFVAPESLRAGWDRDRVLKSILAEGITCQYGTCAEIYREQAFVDAGLAPDTRLPAAREFHETCLAFFVHPTLEATDVRHTVAAVRKVMEVAGR